MSITSRFKRPNADNRAIKTVLTWRPAEGYFGRVLGHSLLSGVTLFRKTPKIARGKAAIKAYKRLRMSSLRRQHSASTQP